MSGQVNRYTLNLIIDEQKTIPLVKGTLEQIDEVTTMFKNKQELLNAIVQTFDINLDGRKGRISVTYNQNKKLRYLRVLYSNNKGALNKEAVGDKLLLYSANTDFVLQFVKRYCNSPYMSTIANEVVDSIRSNEDYTESLQRIIDLTFSSYKAIRDIYFFVKDYENLGKSEIIESQAPQLNSKTDLLEALKKLRVMYDYQQLSLFDFEGNLKANAGNNEKPRVKK